MYTYVYIYTYVYVHTYFETKFIKQNRGLKRNCSDHLITQVAFQIMKTPRAWILKKTLFIDLFYHRVKAGLGVGVARRTQLPLALNKSKACLEESFSGAVTCLHSYFLSGSHSSCIIKLTLVPEKKDKSVLRLMIMHLNLHNMSSPEGSQSTM